MLMSLKFALVISLRNSSVLLRPNGPDVIKMPLGTNMTRQRLGQHGEARTSLDFPPDAEHQASARRQHAIHLAQRGRAIGKKLQALLADHDIERVIAQG